MHSTSLKTEKFVHPREFPGGVNEPGKGGYESGRSGKIGRSGRNIRTKYAITKAIKLEDSG